MGPKIQRNGTMQTPVNIIKAYLVKPIKRRMLESPSDMGAMEHLWVQYGF